MEYLAKMVKHPLYMTVAEFSEVLRNANVLSVNAFDPNEKYYNTH